ncbi:MAG: hypothetical protein ACREOK_06625 [Gemmatimonadaceae bacterium]
MQHGTLERAIAVANAKREIATRIRPVCEHFCDEEFEALIQRMAEIDVYFRLRDDWPTPADSATERISNPRP